MHQATGHLNGGRRPIRTAPSPIASRAPFRSPASIKRAASSSLLRTLAATAANRSVGKPLLGLPASVTMDSIA
jgi:hypothetical protein